jgi:hypothetical protein
MGWVFNRNLAIAISTIAAIITLGFSQIAFQPVFGTTISLIHLVGVGNLVISFWLWKKYI